MKDLLRTRRDRLLVRYGLALALACLGLLLQRLLPIRPGMAMYQLPIAAVVVSAWYGGRGPGLLATVASAAGILYWLISPADSFVLPPEFTVSLALFLANAVLLTEFSVGRRRVEHALEESEGRFRLMAETVPEVLWIASIDPPRVLYLSPGYERIWGRPVADVYRGPDLSVDTIHPEDRAFVSSTFKRWMAGEGEGRSDVEYRILRPDGGTRWIHARGTLIRDEQGKAYRASGIAEDITEVKSAQEALAKTQTELAHVTRVTTMGQLAASIAHEVNQPLAAIVISGNACLHWLAGAQPNLDQARLAASRTVKDANRAADVIARVRALTKKSSARKDWVDINETIGEVITLARAEAQKSRVALQTRLSADVPPVLGDRIQLQQVILNLIVNGIEAMSEAADGPRDLVIASAKQRPDGVVVAVCDCGAGLGSGPVERLFDAFYTTKPGGMGMGLAISRSIVEAHGGRIWATPNTPRGAVFQFTLPVGASASS
jgi:PAS domain S-box-containing protein